MNIAGRQIGPGNPPYLVAEVSGEHKGKIGLATALIVQAKEAGFDAVKLQCFNPEQLAEARGGKDKILESGLWKERKLLDLYRETHTPRQWFPELIAAANEMGITLFTSVFHPDDVEFALDVGCPALKIAAAEANDRRLIMEARATGLPVIISSNSTFSRDIENWGLANILLHCPPGYPCPLEKADLKRIRAIPHTMVGFSDHTLGSTAAIVATALGAVVIEKHITVDRMNGGPDASFSLDPNECKQFVNDIRNAYASL